ncbi:MAG: AI-2E family transporter, partial [Salinisphaera sp.]|nr:AI-2E family transporter [Salinisphaera sp.]
MLGAALVLALLWTVHGLPQLTSMLLLVFAGAVLAVVLDALTGWVAALVPGSRALAFALTIAAIVVVIAGIALLIAPRIAAEAPQLAQKLPQAWNQLQVRLDDLAVVQPMLDEADRPLHLLAGHGNLWRDMLSSTFGFLFNLFVIVFVGVYTAANPERYLSLGATLLPSNKRRQVRELSAA